MGNMTVPVLHAEQDMLTIPEHLMSLSVFMRVRIVQALVLIVVFLFVPMFVIVSSYFAFGLAVLLKL